MIPPAAETPIPAEAEHSAASVGTGRPYQTGTWKGRAHYRCASCSYDTLDFGEIDRHVRLAHAAKTTTGKE